MRLAILGGLRVLDGDQPLDLGGPKQRVVLAVLALNLNRVVSVDRLVEVLWGDDPPPQATLSLQAYISHLRRVLEPDRAPRQPPRLLVTQAPGYQLVLDRADVDFARFEALGNGVKTPTRVAA